MERTRNGEEIVAVPVLAVTPEPTEEELAAIVSTVTLLARVPAANTATGERVAPAPGERWRMAGRRQALRAVLPRALPRPLTRRGGLVM